jgi:hypothetical protein
MRSNEMTDRQPVSPDDSTELDQIVEELQATKDSSGKFLISVPIDPWPEMDILLAQWLKLTLKPNVEQ